MSNSIQQGACDGYAVVADIFGAACPQFRAANSLDPMVNQFGIVEATVDRVTRFRAQRRAAG